MKLTIILADNAVYKDNLVYLDLNLSSCQIPNNVRALQWNESSGHIEFNNSTPNEDITILPDWANACVSVWEAKDYETKNPPTPTSEELILKNESKAKELLINSDWTQLSDVNLTNKSEWDDYRKALRAIATNPTDNPVFPVKPQSIW